MTITTLIEKETCAVHDYYTRKIAGMISFIIVDIESACAAIVPLGLKTKSKAVCRMEANQIYREFSSYLRDVFGCRVQKITIDAGLTCPNRDGAVGYGGCIYCNARGSGTGAAKQLLSVTKQLEMGKARLSKRYKARKFLAYFQSFSNTYAPLATLKRLYEEALAVEDVVGLSIGTRPDCVAEETLEYLEDLSKQRLIWLEYGLQSASDATLVRINRGHRVDAFQDAVRRTRSRRIPVCAHVILGLPGETQIEMLETARFLAGQDIQAVKIHLLYVVRGTVLDTWYRAGAFQCLSRDEYTSSVAQFLTLLPSHVIIQRLTGDPHPEELVAPVWALDKQRNLRAIHDYMKLNQLHQGEICRPRKAHGGHSDGAVDA
jgi:radical SAM protein (TIGR01212 family)